MHPAEFTWGALSTRQAKVLTWWVPSSGYADYNGIICDGAIRSGKTVCMAFSFVLWAMHSFNNQQFALCGKTISSLRRNVLGQLKRQLRSRGFQLEEKHTENLVVVRDGDIVNHFYLFGGKDEASQDLIQGITLAGVLFDEVALMPQSFVNQATARCSVTGSKMWFNCNPASQFHWFYQEWILQCKRRKILYLHFTMDDNFTLSEEIRERYKSQWTGVFYKRFILGQWVASEGVIYDMFSTEKHVVKVLPELDPDIWISCDFGTQNPTCFLQWQKVHGQNKYCLVKEYYWNGREMQRQKTVSDYADDLQAMLGVDELGMKRMPKRVIIDPSATPLIAELRKRRFAVLPAKNDVVEGISDVAQMLQQERLLIHASCKSTIEEFSVYQWDMKAAEHGEDKPIKEHDHAMDALRYFVKSMALVRRQGINYV